MVFQSPRWQLVTGFVKFLQSLKKVIEIFLVQILKLIALVPSKKKKEKIPNENSRELKSANYTGKAIIYKY